MKRALAIILLVVLLSLSLSSCSFDTLEIKNRLIVQAVGIDVQGDNINVSLQVLNTAVSSNPNSGNAPKDVVKYYEFSGKSISDAINKASEVTGKKPLLSQNRIVIFGNNTAKKGLSKYCDYFIRHPDCRATTTIAIAENKASDIIFADMGEGVIPARQIESILKASILNGTTPTIAIFEFVNKMKDDNTSAIVPVIKAEEKEDVKEITVKSSGFFKKDILVGEADENTTSGYLWLKNEVSNAEIPCIFNDEIQATFNISKSKAKITTQIRNNKPFVKIDVICSLDCSEINDSVFNVENETDIKIMKESMENKIKELIENSIKMFIIDNNADVFGFGAQFMLKETSYYKNNVTNWNESMKDLEYEVNVESEIKLIGESSAILYGKK